MLSVTRIWRFSARHRLAAPALSVEQNEQLYGRCGRLPGHGHNYRVEITVSGPCDPQTGLLIGRDQLDRLVGQTLGPWLAWQNLNRRLADESMDGETNPTGENLARLILRRVQERLPNSLTASRVVVHETRKNRFTAFADEHPPPWRF